MIKEHQRFNKGIDDQLLLYASLNKLLSPVLKMIDQSIY
jgi:hypothetical protein